MRGHPVLYSMWRDVAPLSNALAVRNPVPETWNAGHPARPAHHGLDERRQVGRALLVTAWTTVVQPRGDQLIPVVVVGRPLTAFTVLMYVAALSAVSARW